MQELGKGLVLLGVIVAAVGVLLWLRFPIGKLPGDIVVEKERFKFYFPLTTSIVISLVLTLLFWLIRR